MKISKDYLNSLRNNKRTIENGYEDSDGFIQNAIRQLEFWSKAYNNTQGVPVTFKEIVFSDTDFHLFIKTPEQQARDFHEYLKNETDLDSTLHSNVVKVSWKK